MSRTFACVACLLILASGTNARAGDDVFTSKNAATWYLRAVEESDRLSTNDWDAVASFEADPTQPPPREMREIVARGRKTIDLTQRGASRNYADFDLDLSLGAELLLPHLGRLRAIARLMRADALIRLHDGDANGASRLVASMYRLAGHLTSDRTLISSLVGMAIYAHADEVAQVAFDQAAFDAAHSARLLQAVRRLDRPDPFDVAGAVAMEQEVMVDWVADRAEADGGLAGMVEEIATFNDGLLDRIDLTALATLDVEAQVQQYDDAMTEVVEAFYDPDRDAARARLDELNAEIEDGEYGLIAAVMTPALSKVLDLLVESRRMVEERLTMLEALATGAALPRDEANAAYLYLQAIEMLARIEPASLDELRAFDARPAAALDDSLDRMLTEAQPVLDVLRDASELARCDFSFARRRDPGAIAPSYAPGMRDAVRLVHVDALRRARAHESDATIDRLAILLRMSAHLGGDGVIVSSLIAHGAFNQARALWAVALEADDLTDDHRSALRADAERIGRTDPFGYIAGVVAARQIVAAHFRERITPGETGPDRLEAAADATGRLDGDQTLFLVVVLDTLRRTGAGAGAGDDGAAAPAPAALADVLDPAALEAARRLTPRVAPALAAARLDELADIDVSALAHVEAHRGQARSDLRAGLRLLRPPVKRDDGAAATDSGAPPPAGNAPPR
ncbi:MAG: hypothetical protein ACYTGG_04780 [Planctomycetota bacterium]|jgi:hypothetical protein